MDTLDTNYTVEELIIDPTQTLINAIGTLNAVIANDNINQNVNQDASKEASKAIAELIKKLVLRF